MYLSKNLNQFGFKPQLKKAIIDCGIELKSEVQHKCIPQAILGRDILCSAKSSMGKTAVFVLATLQKLDPVEGQVAVLVICHSQELAKQIGEEYERFSKYMSTIRVSVFADGMNQRIDELVLHIKPPHIVVGTPGRILDLIREEKLHLKHLKHLIVDQCDQAFKRKDMRRDIEQIFKATPHEKQVMIFSATLFKDIRLFCKKFMKDIDYVEEELVDRGYQSCTGIECTNSGTGLEADPLDQEVDDSAFLVESINKGGKSNEILFENMREFTGASNFMSIDEPGIELREGDIIQIAFNNLYYHTIFYKDPENCYHVTPDIEQNGFWNSSLFAFSFGSFGTPVRLCRHPFRCILYSGDQRDNDGNIIVPKFRVNNQESDAISRGIDVDLCKSKHYLDYTFAGLNKLIDSKIPYFLPWKNCESYALGWKWGQEWSPQVEVTTCGLFYLNSPFYSTVRKFKKQFQSKLSII